MRRRLILYLCAIVILTTIVAVGCSSGSPAQRVVDGYLQAIKRGQDTVVYKNAKVDDFINVLEFKFLNVESSRTIDNVATINEDSFQKTYRLMYSTLAEAIKGYKEIYGDKAVISETAKELVIKIGFQNEHILLYDVTCTNALGQKVYGKYRFIVLQKLFEKEFEIVDWYK